MGFGAGCLGSLFFRKKARFITFSTGIGAGIGGLDFLNALEKFKKNSQTD